MAMIKHNTQFAQGLNDKRSVDHQSLVKVIYSLGNLISGYRHMMTKNQRLVIAFGTWALLIMALSGLLKMMDFEYFFVLCLIGFLIIVQITGPFYTRPKWRSRVNIVVVIGVLIFALIILQKVLNLVAR